MFVNRNPARISGLLESGDPCWPIHEMRQLGSKGVLPLGHTGLSGGSRGRSCQPLFFSLSQMPHSCAVLRRDTSGPWRLVAHLCCPGHLGLKEHLSCPLPLVGLGVRSLLAPRVAGRVHPGSLSIPNHVGKEGTPPTLFFSGYQLRSFGSLSQKALENPVEGTVPRTLHSKA